MNTEIVHDPPTDGSGRYRLLVDGSPAGSMEYRVEEDRRIFTHTEVDDAYEGKGLAGELARRVLDDARADGVAVIPQCNYLASWIERHDDYADLVDQQGWDRRRGR